MTGISPQFRDEEAYPDGDEDDAREAVLDLLADWIESGRSPATLLNAMHETMCEIVAKCCQPMQ